MIILSTPTELVKNRENCSSLPSVRSFESRQNASILYPYMLFVGRPRRVLAGPGLRRPGSTPVPRVHVTRLPARRTRRSAPTKNCWGWANLYENSPLGRASPPANRYDRQGRPPHQHYPSLIFRCVRVEITVGREWPIEPPSWRGGEKYYPAATPLTPPLIRRTTAMSGK